MVTHTDTKMGTYAIMTVKIRLEPVTIPKGLTNANDIIRAIKNVYTQEAEAIKADFITTTETWNNKPTFTIEKLGQLNRVIGTASLIYKFISGGTRVRYATMTPDFVAKSRVKVIASRKGRGGMAYINTKKPKPGIKAREFDTEIAKKWRKLLPAIVERAIRNELEKRG